MVRRIGSGFVVVLLAVLSAHGQATNPSAAAATGAASGAKTVSIAKGAASPSNDDLAKACKVAARYTPAYAYCDDIVVYFGADSLVETLALQPLVAINQKTDSLASAYAVRKLASMVNALGTTDQIVDKAAQSAPGNALKKQVASPPGGNGSTSLVSKTAATTLIGIAVESGALTQSQSGNTMTLQANADHLFEEAFTGTSDLGYLPKGTPYLENFTIGASLAVNSNSTISVPTTGSATAAPVNASMVSLNSSATKLSSLTLNY